MQGWGTLYLCGDGEVKCLGHPPNKILDAFGEQAWTIPTTAIIPIASTQISKSMESPSPLKE
jgi:hypothetical protein